MNLKEIVEPVVSRKTEYYALDSNGQGFLSLMGEGDLVFPSVGALEKELVEMGFAGEYIIVTKVKKVVVTKENV